MNAETTTTPPETTAPPPVAVAKPEPPFSVDALSQSTARFTHQAWGVFMDYRNDLEAIQFKRLGITLEATSEVGATELATLLTENSVGGVNQFGVNLTFPSTFAKLQTIIKHPAVKLVDLFKID
jgi:hypothetical protein